MIVAALFGVQADQVTLDRQAAAVLGHLIPDAYRAWIAAEARAVLHVHGQLATSGLALREALGEGTGHDPVLVAVHATEHRRITFKLASL